MIISLFYILLAIACVSLLIFFHELGHYIMARRVGMRVETFSIGFGYPIVSWKQSDVNWQIGCIPFGGYVKIANAEENSEQDPYTIPDGYFGKPPLDRIKVAIAGPLVNIVLALILFAALWLMGGREKSFGQFTPLIGWIDTKSALYEHGVRPGDEITSYNGASFNATQEHIYAPTLNGSESEMSVGGFYHNYALHQKIPFLYDVVPYPHPRATDRAILTAGILQPANYVIYGNAGKEEVLPSDSPMYGSGIMPGDRVLWVDGELIFSSEQLAHVLNDDRVLVSVQRGNEVLLRRVPRVLAQELRFSHELKEELADWQYEAKLQDKNLQSLWILPYDLTNEGIVIAKLRLIDDEKEPEIFPKETFTSVDEPLQRGDRIIAVQGTPVQSGYQIMSLLQTRKANVIVERNQALSSSIDWRLANEQFNQEIPWQKLQEMALSIGTEKPITNSESLFLLGAVVPKSRSAIASADKKESAAALEEQKKEINKIKDPEKRSLANKLLESHDKQLILGLPNVHDRVVDYNPGPFSAFFNLFSEIWGTLKALVTGNLSPKWLAGPVGIVQIVKDNSMQGIKEGLFWMGAISLNLGILNLLPIPVLDGGSILLSLVELVTKRRIAPKTLEKIVFPFVLLMIGFFLFLTYNDIWRIFAS
jgi:regulator of sigma E protease